MHDGSLSLEDLQMRRALADSRQSTVPVGDLPGDHFARTRTPQLASPVALANLGAFVLGNDALHLGQQARLRIVLDLRCVMESNGHAVARELVKYDDLIRVHAG